MDTNEHQKNNKNKGDVNSNGYNPSYPITLDNSFKLKSHSDSDMKVDPYKIKEKYLNWKTKTDSGISDITKFNLVPN